MDSQVERTALHEAAHAICAVHAAKVLGAPAALLPSFKMHVYASGGEGELSVVAPSSFSEKQVHLTALYCAGPLAISNDVETITQTFKKCGSVLKALETLDADGELSEKDWEQINNVDLNFEVARVIAATRLSLDALGEAGQAKLAKSVLVISQVGGDYALTDLVPSRAVSRHLTQAKTLCAEAFAPPLPEHHWKKQLRK